MDANRTLVATGTVGAILAAICCATPLLAVGLGALGLTAWLTKADYVVIPVLLISLMLLGVGLYRRRISSQQCCDSPVSSKAASHE